MGLYKKQRCVCQHCMFVCVFVCMFVCVCVCVCGFVFVCVFVCGLVCMCLTGQTLRKPQCTSNVIHVPPTAINLSQLFLSDQSTGAPTYLLIIVICSYQVYTIYMRLFCLAANCLAVAAVIFCSYF